MHHRNVDLLSWRGSTSLECVIIENAKIDSVDLNEN